MLKKSLKTETTDNKIEISKNITLTGGYGGEFYDSLAENFCFDEETINAYSTSIITKEDISLKEIYNTLLYFLDPQSKAITSQYWSDWSGGSDNVIIFNKFKITKFKIPLESTEYLLYFNDILIMEQHSKNYNNIYYKKLLPYLYFLQEFLSDIQEGQKIKENKKEYEQLMKGIKDLLY